MTLGEASPSLHFTPYRKTKGIGILSCLKYCSYRKQISFLYEQYYIMNRTLITNFKTVFRILLITGAVTFLVTKTFEIILMHTTTSSQSALQPSPAHRASKLNSGNPFSNVSESDSIPSQGYAPQFEL